MIKQDVQWKENKLPGLIKHLKVICDRQVAEAQKAIIHHGEWRFEPVHSSFEIPEHLWFQMPQEKKKWHLQKVMTATPQHMTSMQHVNMQSTSSSKTQSTVLNLSFQESGITTIHVAPG